MLFIVTLIMLVIAAVFIHGTFYGAPFLPSRDGYLADALDMLNLKPGQTMLELGSGDGRVLLAAAARGWNVVGYEINPLLFVYSWLRTRRYRGQVRLVFGNYWDKPLPPAAGIYVFLLQPYMAKLDAKLQAEIQQPTKLVSFAFHIPGKQPLREKPGIFLYQY